MIFDIEKIKARETYNLLIGLVAPRPIALVTSMNEEGRMNAAPFSSYNDLCTDPPIIGMGVMNRPSGDFVPKDTARNIRRTGEFVVNVVTEDIAQQVDERGVRAALLEDRVELLVEPAEAERVHLLHRLDHGITSTASPSPSPQKKSAAQ